MTSRPWLPHHSVRAATGLFSALIVAAFGAPEPANGASFDWTNVDPALTSGGLFLNVDDSGVNVTITVENASFWILPTEVYSGINDGGAEGVQGIVTVAFDPPVTNLNFTFGDIDQASSTLEFRWDDAMHISGSPSITGTNINIALDGWSPQCCWPVTEGSADVFFDGVVSEVVFTHGPGGLVGANAGTVLWSDFTFDPITTCSDGVMNGDESDVDCGGQCPVPCDSGKLCGGASDCASGVCVGGTCVQASCGDGVMNSDESDVDCGGACAPCAIGRLCGNADDCASMACDGVVCVQCLDNMPGASTDLGCGVLAPFCVDLIYTSICSSCLDTTSSPGGQDAGCGNLTPICSGIGPSTTCVECATDADCQASEVCFGESCVVAGQTVAEDDAYLIGVGETLVRASPATGCAANDTVAVGGAPSVSIAGSDLPSPSTVGTLMVAADGTFSFTPVPGYAGVFTVPYVLTDGLGGVDEGALTITVNDPPGPIELGYLTGPGELVQVARPILVQNLGLVTVDDPSDGDTDGIRSIRVADATTGPFGSTATLAADGVCTFDAQGNLAITAPTTGGTSTCWVEVCEELPATSPAVCSVGQVIVVVAVDETVAVDDRYIVAVNTVLSVADPDLGLLGNDFVVSGGAPNVVVDNAQLPNPITQGTTIISADGTLAFVPVPGFVGTVGFAYLLKDGLGNQDDAVVQIVVNDPPAVASTNATLVAGSLRRIPVNELVLGPGIVRADDPFDGDIDGLVPPTLGTTVAGPFASSAALGVDGSCVLDGADVVVTAPTTAGVHRCFLQTCDELPANTPAVCALAEIEIFVTPDGPSGTLAVDDVYNAIANTVLAVNNVDDGLLANDFADAATASVTVPSGGLPSSTKGTLVVATNGTFEFTPAPGFTGAVVVPYELTDANGMDTAQVTIVVTQPDSDDDGLEDSVELELGTDPLDADTDNDGLADALEIVAGDPLAYDLGLDTDPLDADTDDDGLADGAERQSQGPVTGYTTSPVDRDSDGDGLTDGVELGVVAELPGGVSDGPNQVAFSGTDSTVFRPDLDPESTTDPGDMDSDDDGLADGVEDADGNGRQDATIGATGTSGTGETDPADADSDNDGVRDGVELGVVSPVDASTLDFVPDQDPSTVTDPLDVDTDDGGVPDGVEDLNHNGRVDAGEQDPLDATDDDGDDDGLTEAEEAVLGTDPFDNDSDDDGLSDGEELSSGVPGVLDADDTDPLDADSDDDGLADGSEIDSSPIDADSDDDGLSDGLELGVDRPVAGGQSEGPTPSLFAGTDVLAPSWQPDADPSTTTDPTQRDSDEDGLDDGEEDLDADGAATGLVLGDTGTVGAGETDASVADTDGDGVLDGQEVLDGTSAVDADTDDGGAPDGAEAVAGTDPLDPDDDITPDDADGDRLSDADELALGTDPADRDTDNDGLLDGAETRLSPASDPLDADTDDDGLSDGDEVALGSAPTLFDTDSDGISDGVEAGVQAPTVGGTSDNAGIPYRGTADGFEPDADPATTTSPIDTDSDDDGLSDGVEDLNRDGMAEGLETDASTADTDGDGLLDGTELGVTQAGVDTDLAAFVADADPKTTTNPLMADSDGGGIADGAEDLDHNGRLDDGEGDPLWPDDDVSLLPRVSGTGCSAFGGSNPAPTGWIIFLIALGCARTSVLRSNKSAIHEWIARRQ